MPSGATASAAGLRGQAAGARRSSAHARAAAAEALLLRVLADVAPGLVPVPLAPQQLPVGQRPRQGRAVAEVTRAGRMANW